jgi:hypothetical protein
MIGFNIFDEVYKEISEINSTDEKEQIQKINNQEKIAKIADINAGIDEQSNIGEETQNQLVVARKKDEEL